MNILGHAYLAFRVVGRLNKYLVAGSHLPDLVPFVPDSVFTFEEIHESPEKVLGFLEQKYPHARDLALGMMIHSVEYGADKFNNEIENWLLEGKRELKNKLLEEIIDCTGSNQKLVKGYLHNSLWYGIEIYLLKRELETVKKIAQVYEEINFEEIAVFLAECFEKEETKVKRMINFFFSPIKPGRLLSLEGLVEIAKAHFAGLPEKGRLDKEKAAQLAEKIYRLFENQWERILENILVEVKGNLAPFLL